MLTSLSKTVVVCFALFCSVSATSQAAVFVGATLDKDIDGLPDGAMTVTPSELAQLGDLTFTEGPNPPGEPNVQSSFLDLDPAVDANVTIDASHVISRTFAPTANPDGSYDVVGYEVIVSFIGNETIAGGAGATADHELVRIINDNGTITSEVVFDSAGIGVNLASTNLNAFHLLSETDTEIEFLVSYDNDITNFGISGNTFSLGNDDVARVTVDKTTGDATAASLFLDLQFGSKANLDAFTILSDGSYLGSFAQTIDDPEDSSVQDHDIWRFLGPTDDYRMTVALADASVGLYLDNTGIDTNVNLESLFSVDVPEPGVVALFGLGFAGIYAARRRRVNT